MEAAAEVEATVEGSAAAEAVTTTACCTTVTNKKEQMLHQRLSLLTRGFEFLEHSIKMCLNQTLHSFGLGL